MSGFLSKVRTASLPVYLLVIVFAMSTWIDIVGVWVEMPLMVNVLPEAWQLPAYLTVIIQCANIGPAIYATVDKFRASRNSKTSTSTGKNSHPIHLNRNHEILLIFIILVVGTLATFFMAFFWSRTVYIFGSERSLPFMILVLFSSLVSCMSSVVFLPYMANFKSVYISAYYIGQGLCGLVPGLVGLMQGLGKPPECVNTTLYNQSVWRNETNTVLRPVYDPPTFSVQSFLVFLTSCMLCSGIAFYCLNFMRVSRSEMVTEQHDRVPEVRGKEVNGSTDRNKSEVNGLLKEQQQRDGGGGEDDERDEGCVEVRVEQSSLTSKSLPLLISIGVVSAMTNGILPATQSYTCLPFGSMVYTLAIRLSSVVGPLASLSTMFLPLPSVRVVIGLTMSGTLIAVFHLVLAFQSPTPILQGLFIGNLLVILSSVVMAGCYSFVRVSVASVLREQGSRRALFWCGGVTQLGSFCGAIVTFILVSILHVFQSAKPCTL